MQSIKIGTKTKRRGKKIYIAIGFGESVPDSCKMIMQTFIALLVSFIC